MEHLLYPSNIEPSTCIHMLRYVISYSPCSTLTYTPHRSGIELCTGVLPSCSCTVLCNHFCSCI